MKYDFTFQVMCAYKLVSINFKWTGLTHLVEKTVQKQYPRIFSKFHRYPSQFFKYKSL